MIQKVVIDAFLVDYEDHKLIGSEIASPREVIAIRDLRADVVNWRVVYIGTGRTSKGYTKLGSIPTGEGELLCAGEKRQ
jgi:hypothetical protein